MTAMARITLCALLFPVLLLLLPPARGESRFRRGDSTGDGRVDISDPVATLFHLFGGLGLGCFDGADADDDGSVALADAVATLEYLFLEGPRPKAPGDGACPGLDPTSDGLDCARGEPEPADRPSIAVWPEFPPAPAVRQRRGERLPAAAGVFSIPQGVSFAILVEAASNRVTRAGFDLDDAADSRAGNPEALFVACGRDLGDPNAGGIPAGENLAGLFFRDIDRWTDPIYLIERAALIIDARSALAPRPGRYRFQARVTDEACATSAAAFFDLDVAPSGEPELHVWLEDDVAGAPSGSPRPASAATGGLAAAWGEAVHLVVWALPNAAAGEDPDLAIDPASFWFSADIQPRFTFEGARAGGLRWRIRLDPVAEVFPAKGNARLYASIAARRGDTAPAVHTLEIKTSYAEDIQPIWTRECTGCHERPQLEKGLELVGPPPLRTHRNIVNVYAAQPAIDSAAPLLIRPYDPERSYLIHKIEGTQIGPPVLGSGDRMPRGGPPFLSAGELKLIRDWVSQGARND